MNEFLLDGWTPGVNGTGSAGWGRREDHKDTAGPEICWDHDGSVQPMALLDMTAEEKEVNARPEMLTEDMMLTDCSGFRYFCQFSSEAPSSKY